MAPITTSQWSIGDVVCTSRGSKIAPLKCEGKHCVYTPDSYLRVVFEPGSFDKDPTAQRLNLVLECDDDFQAQIQAFDVWFVEYLATNSERLLKRKMSPEQVLNGYCSCVKLPTGGKSFQPTLKTKIDLDGNGAIRCWDTNGASITMPYTWRGLKVKPRLNFSHLWIMGAQFGVVLKITDVEIACNDVPEVVVNPFLEDRASPVLKGVYCT
jgi:hypothetical protein